MGEAYHFQVVGCVKVPAAIETTIVSGLVVQLEFDPKVKLDAAGVADKVLILEVKVELLDSLKVLLVVHRAPVANIVRR